MANGCDMLLHDIDEAVTVARRLEAEGKRTLAKMAWGRARKLCTEAAQMHDASTKVGQRLRWMQRHMGGS